MNICDNGIYREMTPDEVSLYQQSQTSAPHPTPTDQALTFLRSMASTYTTLTDTQALAMPDILPTWEELLEAGKTIEYGVCLMHNGQCYRVTSSNGVLPQEHQPPGGEGMLSVYTPIDREHAGTLEDPIPFVYGMETKELLYYSYEGKIYRVAKGGGMKNCVYLPDTGIWQWELVE